MSTQNMSDVFDVMEMSQSYRRKDEDNRDDVKYGDDDQNKGVEEDSGVIQELRVSK